MGGGVKPHVIFNPRFFWRDLESWLKVGRNDFCGEIDRQLEKHHRKKILTIYSIWGKDGVFSGPAMFNLTECIYYEGITFLPDSRNSLADDSTSSFLS